MKRTKRSYSLGDIRKTFGLSERTMRRWTELGIIEGTPDDDGNFKYPHQPQFHQVVLMRSQGFTLRQIETELPRRMSLLAADAREAAKTLFVDAAKSGAQRRSSEYAHIHLPLNAEYLLYLMLQRGERDAALGDITEDYGRVLVRFGKKRANVWLYKQVLGSVLPLLSRAVRRLAGIVCLGRLLRNLIS